MFGFSASSLTRTTLGAGFCILAGGLVWIVERPRSAIVTQVTAEPTVKLSSFQVRLVVESTYPVASWQVSENGLRSEAGYSTEWIWEGMVPGFTGGEVLVVAPAIQSDATPNRCLRLRLGNEEPVVIWGSGVVTAALAIP